MNDTEINYRQLEQELNQLPLIAAGDTLGLPGSKKHRFMWEWVSRHPKCWTMAIHRSTEDGVAQVGHSHIRIGFTPKPGILLRPQIATLIAQGRIDSFTPRPLFPTAELPEREAATFGEGRARAAFAEHLEDASFESQLFQRALEQILGAIERAVVPA